jgi:hypothetical protein
MGRARAGARARTASRSGRPQVRTSPNQVRMSATSTAFRHDWWVILKVTARHSHRQPQARQHIRLR